MVPEHTEERATTCARRNGPNFLDLALELRLQIYSYMTVPDEVSFWHYRGLYASCKQIHHEMEDECGKILSQHLQNIANAWPAEHALGLQVTGGFAQMHRVILKIPEQYVTDEAISADIAAGRRFTVDMSPLFALHLQSITILITTTGDAEEIPAYRHLICMTGMGVPAPKEDINDDLLCYIPANDCNVRRIVLDATTTFEGSGGSVQIERSMSYVVTMETQQDLKDWETWSMYLPRSSTDSGQMETRPRGRDELTVWIKKVSGGEEKSTQLWVQRLPKDWTRYPHHGWSTA